MYNKIYIIAEGLEKPEEIEKFSYLFDVKNVDEIWDASMKVGKPYDGKIYDVGVLEIFLFFNYLISNGYKKEDIVIIHKESMFIYDEELYFIRDSKIINVNTENVGFFSLRSSNLDFPFFFILKNIVESKGGCFCRTNDFFNYVHGKGKFYAVYQLYQHRKESLGDVVIPYNIYGENLIIFKDFLKKYFSENIVIKKDFSCAGKGVFVIDLENFDELQKNKMSNSLVDNGYFNRTSYILPYYDFKEEFRFYFNKDKNGIKIYSFKRKRVLSSLQDAINSENFQYFKNIKINWEYIGEEEYGNYKRIFDYALKNLEILQYTTGTFECGETQDGRIIFFEVNPMSATVCFDGPDQEDMKNFYIGIFDNLFEKSIDN